MAKNVGDKNIDDKTRKMIQACYAEIGNFTRVGEIFGYDKSTIKKIIDKDKEKISTLVNKKKIENTQSVLDYMDTQSELKKIILHNSLEKIVKVLENEDITASDLTRIYGVIMDKELTSYATRKTPSDMATQITIIDSLPKDEENE